LIAGLRGRLNRLLGRRRKPDIPQILEWVSRVGYGARGFVYLSIGALAAMAAIELARSPASASGAVAAFAQGPIGQIWIAAVAAGLFGFALWRGLQAVFDADRQGRGPAAIAGRIGQAVSGLAYGTLAWSLLELLDELEDIGEADENQSARQMAADLMAVPFGHWLLIGVALFVAGVGVAGIVQLFRPGFGKRLGCNRQTHRWACLVGRIGYAARGLAFLPLAYTLARAGWDMSSAEARNLGGALQALEAQPFGSPILFVTGLGLGAFGLYALIEARWRRIDPPDPT
jgi:hypothetical protein